MKPSLAVIPLLVFLLVFFYAPFAILAYQSFTGVGGRLTLENYLTIVRDPSYTRIVFYSIMIASETTLVTLALAYPVAYYVARVSTGREKILLLALLLTPFWVDVLLRSLAIKTVIYTIGLKEGFHAMMLGMIYEYFPIMLLPLFASLSRIPDNLLEAARVLGASTRDLLSRVIIPLTLPGIIAGSLLVLLMSMTEFVIPALLGGKSGFTVGSLIYYLFLSGGMWGVGAALAVIITVALMVAAFAVARRTGEDML
ncbi:MAG: ABC transporter permease [Desulfurococcales archaeon]|nr:ABC transporter permease [Desulfurococcales archaeon]